MHCRNCRLVGLGRCEMGSSSGHSLGCLHLEGRRWTRWQNAMRRWNIFLVTFFPLFFVYKGWTKPWYDIKLSSYCIGSLTGDVFKSVSAWFCWLHLTSKDKMETLFQRMQRSVKIIQSSGVGSVLEWNERSNVGNTERWVESVKLVERTVAKVWGNRVQISNPTSKNRC